MASLIPKVPITLDRPRYLVMDYAALQAIEGVTGVPYYELFAEGRRFTAKEFTAIVWAALLDDDPELQIEHVAKMLSPGNIGEISTAFGELLQGSTPPLATASNGQVTAGEPPQNPQSIGSTSGALHATISD